MFVFPSPAMSLPLRQYNFQYFLELYVSSVYLLSFSSQPCIYHLGRGKLWRKEFCSNYRKMHLRVKKLNINIFYSCPEELSPRFLSSPPARRKLLTSRAAIFFKSVPSNRKWRAGRENDDVTQIPIEFFHT